MHIYAVKSLIKNCTVHVSKQSAMWHTTHISVLSIISRQCIWTLEML